MNTITRSGFLRSVGGLMVVPGLLSNLSRKVDPKFSFSTLGCPDWDLPQVIEFASAHQYKAVEIRGLMRELDLSKSKHFNSPASIAETKKMFSDKNIAIAGLGASCELHYKDPSVRQKNLDEAKRFIVIAEKLGAPMVRVFPNRFLKDIPRDESITLISERLRELGNHAVGSGVRVLMETHGDLLLSDDLLTIMQSSGNENTGLVWDVANMWSKYKEPPLTVYNKLKNYIYHSHIKDVKMNNNDEKIVLLGRGDVPVFEAMDIMNKNGFRGYFSFEWEKLWNPELEAPEVAFADFSKVVAEHFRR
ncbi:MAG: sugar phosphate isomerase/epimerase [Chitinophagaceae bacterium]|nr:sugar phosphate isomerase/epimerase [Chitinophagaceae bacterium]